MVGATVTNGLNFMTISRGKGLWNSIIRVTIRNTGEVVFEGKRGEFMRSVYVQEKLKKLGL